MENDLLVTNRYPGEKNDQIEYIRRARQVNPMAPLPMTVGLPPTPLATDGKNEKEFQYTIVNVDSRSRLIKQKQNGGSIINTINNPLSIQALRNQLKITVPVSFGIGLNDPISLSNVVNKVDLDNLFFNTQVFTIEDFLSIPSEGTYFNIILSSGHNLPKGLKFKGYVINLNTNPSLNNVIYDAEVFDENRIILKTSLYITLNSPTLPFGRFITNISKIFYQNHNLSDNDVLKIYNYKLPEKTYYQKFLPNDPIQLIPGTKQFNVNIPDNQLDKNFLARTNNVEVNNSSIILTTIYPNDLVENDYIYIYNGNSNVTYLQDYQFKVINRLDYYTVEISNTDITSTVTITRLNNEVDIVIGKKVIGITNTIQIIPGPPDELKITTIQPTNVEVDDIIFFRNLDSSPDINEIVPATVVSVTSSTEFNVIPQIDVVLIGLEVCEILQYKKTFFIDNVKTIKYGNILADFTSSSNNVLLTFPLNHYLTSGDKLKLTLESNVGIYTSEEKNSWVAGATTSIILNPGDITIQTTINHYLSVNDLIYFYDLASSPNVNNKYYFKVIQIVTPTEFKIENVGKTDYPEKDVPYVIILDILTNTATYYTNIIKIDQTQDTITNNDEPILYVIYKNLIGNVLNPSLIFTDSQISFNLPDNNLKIGDKITFLNLNTIPSILDFNYTFNVEYVSNSLVKVSNKCIDPETNLEITITDILDSPLAEVYLYYPNITTVYSVEKYSASILKLNVNLTPEKPTFQFNHDISLIKNIVGANKEFSFSLLNGTFSDKIYTVSVVNPTQVYIYLDANYPDTQSFEMNLTREYLNELQRGALDIVNINGDIVQVKLNKNSYYIPSIFLSNNEIGGNKCFINLIGDITDNNYLVKVIDENEIYILKDEPFIYKDIGIFIQDLINVELSNNIIKISVDPGTLKVGDKVTFLNLSTSPPTNDGIYIYTVEEVSNNYVGISNICVNSTNNYTVTIISLVNPVNVKLYLYNIVETNSLITYNQIYNMFQLCSLNLPRVGGIPISYFNNTTFKINKIKSLQNSKIFETNMEYTSDDTTSFGGIESIVRRVEITQNIAYPNANYFRFTLPRPFKFVNSVQLVSTEFYDNYYVIYQNDTAHNNRFNVKIIAKDSTNYGPEYLLNIIVPTGSYTPVELSSKVEDLLNEEFTKKYVPDNQLTNINDFILPLKFFVDINPNTASAEFSLYSIIEVDNPFIVKSDIIIIDYDVVFAPQMGNAGDISFYPDRNYYVIIENANIPNIPSSQINKKHQLFKYTEQLGKEYYYIKLTSNITPIGNVGGENVRIYLPYFSEFVTNPNDPVDVSINYGVNFKEIFYLDFTDSNFGTLLGFEKKNYGEETNPFYRYSSFDLVQSNKTITNETYTILTIPELNTVSGDPFAKIRLETTFGIDNYVASLKNFNGIPKAELTQLTFIFTNYLGQPFNFGGYEFSLTLLMTEEIDLLENTYSSSQRPIKLESTTPQQGFTASNY